MGTVAKHVGAALWPALKRAVRVASLIALGTVILAGVGVFILWDADNFSLRLRFVTLKYAWFGDWVSEEDLRPETETALVPDVLAEATDITFFRHMELVGTNLTITTGTSFSSTKAVVNNTPSKVWCYTKFGAGDVRKMLDLATREGTAIPIYADLSDLPQSELSELGLSASRLESAARSHCQLGSFEL